MLQRSGWLIFIAATSILVPVIVHGGSEGSLGREQRAGTVSLEELEQSENAEQAPSAIPPFSGRPLPTYMGQGSKPDSGLVRLPQGGTVEVSEGTVLPGFGTVTQLTPAQLCVARRLSEDEKAR